MEVNLLGKFQVLIDGEPVQELNRQKSRALLAYLLIEANRPLRRAFLAELLWPDLPHGVARTNLRQALKFLRQAIGADAASLAIQSTREAIEFTKADPISLDVDHFLRRVESVRAHDHNDLVTCDECARNLEQAAERYQGDFLEDFFLPDSREFEEWASVQREALRQEILFVLEKLIEIGVARGDLEDGIRIARRLVSLDPWDERKHRRLMRLLALSGRRSDALRQFEVCEELMRDEFDVEPSEETRELLEAIKLGEIEGLQHDAASKTPEHEGRRRGRDVLRWALPAAALGLVVVIAAAWLLGRTPGDERDEISQQEDPDSPGGDHHPAAVEPFDPEEERTALMDIFSALDGDSWIRSDGWGSNDDHCDWFGVSCSSGSVTELWLPENNLAGEIPTALNQLPNLVNLDLSFNQLRGEIPPELLELEHLDVLLLSGNTWLEGEIPSGIGELRNLTTLSLSASGAGTQLEGEIPPELGDLALLTHLEIAEARLTGEIPPELGNLTHLEYLDLSGNALSGAIPTSFGQLGNLWHLAVGGSSNDLAGPLPLALTNLHKLEVLMYENTQLCEPRDAAFQAWLSGIEELYRTGYPCP